MHNTAFSMVPQRPVLAYFDPFDVFSLLKRDLYDNLPLVNLHWNHPERPLRLIATLDVDIVEEKAKQALPPKHQLPGLSSTPYLKIIFIQCEDNDTYKASVRPIIREWLDNKVKYTRDPTEWIVVHYIPNGSKVFLGNRFTYGVFDKIKADFNNEQKIDRCIQLRQEYLSQIEYKEAWKELMSRVKDGVLYAFSQRIDLYQTEIVKLEAAKHILGWNFGKFFVMKEGLALSFERMNLFEDALAVYKELETLFDQMLEKKELTFFNSVGFDDIPVSSNKIQDLEKQRHDILSNDITLFDFQYYLFSRQAFLILCIAKASSTSSITASKIGKLYLQLRLFLTEINVFLLSNQKLIQKVAEWSFGIVTEFEEAIRLVDNDCLMEVAEGWGELLLLKRDSLETLAASKGWHIDGIFTNVLLEHTLKSDYQISNTTLQSFLQTPGSFFAHYKQFTEEAYAQFDLTDRAETKDVLSTQLALLNYQLENYAQAANLLENLPNSLNQQGWTLISTTLLEIYVKCLLKLDRDEDLFRSSLELLPHYLSLTKVEISELVATVERLSVKISHSVNLNNYFLVEISTQITNVSGSDLYRMNVTVQNQIPEEFSFDSAVLKLQNLNNSTNILSFSSDGFFLHKSRSVVLEFTTNKFSSGEYRVFSLEFVKGKLIFSQNFIDSTPILISLFPTPQNFYSKFLVPKAVNLKERCIGLELTTGLQPVKKALLRFKSFTVSLKPISMKATSTSELIPVSVTHGRPPIITVENVPASTSFQITVPYILEQDISSARLKAFIEYTNMNDEEFSYYVDQKINISLALSVSVQDFFRSSELFSKFTVSCGLEKDPVRILNANITGNTQSNIASPFHAEINDVNMNPSFSYVRC